LFDFLKKKARRATLQPAGVTLEVARGQKLLTAALEAGLDWPHDCRVGSCGTCRCYLKKGKVKPLRDFIYTLELKDIQAGAILACQSLLTTDVTVEVDFGGGVARIEHHRARLARTRSLTHDIQEIVVNVEAPCFQEARAGQYAELSVAGIDRPRSYSFARPPRLEAVGEVSFFIRHVPGGEFTDWLFAEDRGGTEMEIGGPYGNFYQRDGEGLMICIAGGSGLAPIKALMEAGAEAGCKRRLLVYFGARSQRDLYCLEELEELGGRWGDDFELIPVLSEEPADSGWRGARGLVTEAVERLVDSGIVASECQGYLCGPPPMVDAAIAALEHLGLPRAQIFYDKFEDASTQPRT
jgi:CDP-4-dehydro-6-deoxyglucose reductase